MASGKVLSVEELSDVLKVARDSMVAPFGSRGAATDSLADHLTDLVTNEVQARYFSATGHDSRWDIIRGGISALRARIRKLDELSSTVKHRRQWWRRWRKLGQQLGGGKAQQWHCQRRQWQPRRCIYRRRAEQHLKRRSQ